MDNFNYNEVDDDYFENEYFDYCKDDIIDILEGKKNFLYNELDVQRISPVHFLRDRELGLRVSLTSNHVVGQRVCIQREPAYHWSYSFREKIYRRMFDECKKEEKFSYENNYYCYTTSILRKILCFGKALCISICIDIGKRVELVIMNNLRPSQYRRWKYPRYEIMFRKNCDNDDDDDMKVLHCVHGDVLDRCFQRYKRMNMLSIVQDSERYCLSCAKVTCKCSVENCDVVF